MAEGMYRGAEVSRDCRVFSKPAARAMASGRAADELSDIELARFCASRDKVAWDYLVKRYRALIYSIPLQAFSFQVEDANDVFQDVCLILAQKIGNFRGDCRLSQWIATITRNKCTDYVRKIRPEAASNEVLERIPDESGSVEEKVLECERNHHLDLCVDQLPAQFKQAVHRRLEGLTNNQIAAKERVLGKTVATRIYRSVRLLVECLQKVGIL